MLSIKTGDGQGMSDAVFAFALKMQEKLDEHAEKGDSWKGLTRVEIKTRIRDELTELDKAMIEPHPSGKKITNEAADIANFALFAALTRGILEL